jgi:hypothetical protein
MRKPPPVYKPVDPGPAQLTPEELCADGAFKIPAAAEFLGISKSSVKELLRSGDLPSALVKGYRVIPRRACRLYLAKHF